MIMSRVNYSKNASLLENEMYDLDVAEDWETGINADRMRLPTRYDISKYYQRYKTPSSYDVMGEPRYEKGRWVKRKNELVDFGGEDFDWQITYSFPDTVRNPMTTNGHKYGGANVTYRRLYLILCKALNGGEFFIDEYFRQVYPETIKPYVDERLNNIKAELLEVADDEFEDAVYTKQGKLDKRFRLNKEKMSSYESFAQSWEESEGEELAKLIKEDIIDSLMVGKIPLKHEVNLPKTDRARLRAGLSDEPVFLATGQLIESLQLFINIGGNRKWQTSQGILV